MKNCTTSACSFLLDDEICFIRESFHGCNICLYLLNFALHYFEEKKCMQKKNKLQLCTQLDQAQKNVQLFGIGNECVRVSILYVSIPKIRLNITESKSDLTINKEQ